MSEKKIFVERDPYEKNGKTYYSYFVKGEIRGTEVKALLTPKDIGGYVLLDIVFGSEMKAELVVKAFEMKDDKGRVTMKGNMYGVKSEGENGEVFECDIKPLRPSDKTTLEMLLK